MLYSSVNTRKQNLQSVMETLATAADAAAKCFEEASLAAAPTPTLEDLFSDAPDDNQPAAETALIA